MRISADLIKLGHEISNDYLYKGKDMTESLIKVAETHNLNQHEIQRVGEVANTNTYLALIEKEDDKYLEFPVADTIIVNNLIHTKTATYSSPSNNDTNELDSAIFRFFQVENEYEDLSPIKLEKRASVITESQISEVKPADPISKPLKMAQWLDGVLDHTANVFEDKKGELRELTTNAFNMIKQAVLSGIPFSDVSEVVKAAAPDTAGYLLDNFKAELQKEMYDSDLEKTSEYSNFYINPETNLYKTSSAINTKFTQLEKIANIYTKYAKDYNELVTHYKVGIPKDFEKLSGVLQVMKNAPKTATALIVFPAGVLYGKHLEKEKNLNKVLSEREIDNFLQISNRNFA